MIRLELSDEVLNTINEAIEDPIIDDRIKRKLLTIRLHSLNVPHSKIAQALNFSSDTVTNYLNIYQDKGLEGLMENRYYQPSSKVDPFLDQLRESFENEPVATTKEGAGRIFKITGIELSESQARRIMKRIGMRCRKTAGIPGKADPQLQLDFLTEELLPRLEEAQEGKRRVFFVDAAHFVLGGFLGFIWCFQRIFVPTASGRKRYSILGAVDSENHNLLTVKTEGTVNAGTFCQLLEVISNRHPQERITLVLDNARYQYNGLVMHLAESLEIELLYLPSYSPNLNLIERVWKLVKSKCLRNKYYEDFAAFKKSIDQFLASLNGTNKGLLETLLTHNFQTFTIPKT